MHKNVFFFFFLLHGGFSTFTNPLAKDYIAIIQKLEILILEGQCLWRFLFPTIPQAKLANWLHTQMQNFSYRDTKTAFRYIAKMSDGVHVGANQIIKGRS